MPLKKGDWVRGAGDESYAEYMLRARRRFEQGQVATVRQVRQIYRRAAEAVREDIRQATPGTLRHGHLKALAKVLEQRARSLTSELLEATRAGIHLASREAVSGPEELVVRLVEGTFDRAEVRRLFAAVNERAVLAFLARSGPDGLKLSDRVWRMGERWRNAIVRVLEDGIARGEDARKLALEVQRYLQPGVWTVHKLETRRRLGVSADVSYEAMRLVRTEMNNAFHEATIMANRATPSYLGIYWRLSGEHPFPDVCDDYARHNGDGFWPRGQEPVRPHPQCMCVAVPRHERPEEFSEYLRQWIRDPQSQPGIESWYNQTARQFVKRPSQAFLTPASTANVWRESLEAILRAKETEIAPGAIERAIVLDSRGKILLEKAGGENYVAFTDDELRLMQDAILTHNHPKGYSFSSLDIRLAIEHNLSEIRAVSRRHVYSMVRPESGWPALDKVQAVYEDAEAGISARLWAAIGKGEMTPDQANLEHYHSIWLEVAKQLGLRYERLLR